MTLSSEVPEHLLPRIFRRRIFIETFASFFLVLTHMGRVNPLNCFTCLTLTSEISATASHDIPRLPRRLGVGKGDMASTLGRTGLWIQSFAARLVLITSHIVTYRVQEQARISWPTILRWGQHMEDLSADFRPGLSVCFFS